MRNGILKHGILIVTGALALGACRREGRHTTAQPQYTEPAPGGQDAGAQDAASQPMLDQGGAQVPREGTTGQTMPGQQPAQGTTGAQAAAAGPCPTDVEGAVAVIEDYPEGMAIVFTTPGDVEGVRTRVQRLADEHNQRHAERMQAIAQQQAAATQQQGAAGKAKAGGKKGKAGKKGKKGKASAAAGTGSQRTAQAETSGPPDVIAMTVARVEELPDGARLVYTITETEDVESVREPLRAHSAMMAGAQCEMMPEDMGHGMTPGATSRRAPMPPRPL